MKKQVTIYTDGACSGNPGPGGWGCVLMYRQHIKECSGGAEDTTNNRMEITTALEALKLLKEGKIQLPPAEFFSLEEYEQAFASNAFKAGFRI